MADITKADVIEFIANMSVLELSEMVKEMEDKFGVSAAAPVAMMAAGPVGDGAGANAAEEKNEFDVILTTAGDKKIAVIKEVRAITGLGLKEAKELVEGVPAIVKESITKEDAQKAKEQILKRGHVKVCWLAGLQSLRKYLQSQRAAIVIVDEFTPFYSLTTM